MAKISAARTGAGGTWTAASRIARRELRGGIKGFRIFLACLTLGVAAIAAVGSLNQSVSAGLMAESGRLLGGDIDLRLTHRPADATQLDWLQANARAISEVVEMRAMAIPEDGTGNGRRTMVELKAVDRGYPLAGTIQLQSGGALGQLLAARDGRFGAAVDPGLLDKLGLEIGDTARVGKATFEIRGVIEKEPDRVVSAFSFGPRFMVPMAALRATDLVRPGSQIRYHYRLLLQQGEALAAFKQRLESEFPDAGWRVRGTDNAAPGVERFVDRLTLFLGFVGLTVLLVGGIGVGNAVAAYLDGKTPTIATLKCLGAPARLIFQAYLLQILALSGLGIVLGIVLGGGATWAGVVAFGELLPVAPKGGFYPAAIAEAALFGFLVSLTFAFWPLARARGVKAAELFRARVAPGLGQLRRTDVLWTGVLAAVLAALVILLAYDRWFASWFVVGAIVTLLLLRGAAFAIQAAAKRVHAAPTALLRMVIANLHRPGAATASVSISLGLGLAVLVAVALIDGNMRYQISERLPEEAPAFFFLDIQPDQVERFDEVVSAVPGTGGLQRQPVVRGRIVGIDGTPVSQVDIANDSKWAVRGDRALTYESAMPKGTDLIEGDWWPADYAGPPIVSLDDGLAKGFGVGIGDTLTFNILGREITAEIRSLREIDWRSLRFDFAVIFAPGALEGAPHSHIAAINAPPSAETAVEKAVTDTFANVSAIRVREALAAAQRILEGVSGAVRGVAAVTVVAGILVLAGTIAAGHRRRVFEAVVFKVLGATRGRTLATFLAEYGLLGLLVGLIAAAVGTLAAWAVIVFLMGAEWVFLPETVAVTVVLALIVTLLLGLIGTWHALGHKPLQYLRND